jgi:shikimate dehydrogenase
MKISGTSRPLAVIGDPISHSLSPVMHNAAIAALGLDAVYVALRVDELALPHVIRAFESIGVAGNVTVPHKLAVGRLLIRLTGLAKELGAVNTFWPDGGRLIGDNTDVRGVIDALHSLRPEAPLLVQGTGGSARAVAVAAREMGLPLLARSRSEDRAREFAAWARDIGVEASADDGSRVGIAVNATPAGLEPTDPLPISPDRLHGCDSALDLVYAPGATRWVRECRKLGMRASDGRTMLVAQGAHAFERFFPDVKAPREVMAAAVARSLRP